MSTKAESGEATKEPYRLRHNARSKAKLGFLWRVGAKTRTYKQEKFFLGFKRWVKYNADSITVHNIYFENEHFMGTSDEDEKICNHAKECDLGRTNKKWKSVESEASAKFGDITLSTRTAADSV